MTAAASPPAKRFFLLHASDVASFAGRHKYQPKRETLLRYLKKIDPGAYERLHTDRTVNDVQMRLPPAEERRERGRVLLEAIRSRISYDIRSMATSGQLASSADAAAAAGKVGDAIELACAGSDMTSDDVRDMQDFCRYEIYGAFGTAQETLATKQYERESELTVTKDDVYRKRALCTVALPDSGLARHPPTVVAVYVGGKCDGLCTDPETQVSTVVEVKNRVNRLFGLVPEYERIQLSSYLFIHGVSRGVLVEKYQDRVAHHDVAFDAAYWAQVEADVKASVVELYEMMGDP